MSEDAPAAARALLDQVLAFARSTVPRAAPSRRAVVTDIGLALLVFAAALATAKLSNPGTETEQVLVHGQVVSVVAGGRLRGLPWQVAAAAAATSMPLAARRWRPLTAMIWSGSRRPRPAGPTCTGTCPS